jgi:hypothetical protein
MLTWTDLEALRHAGQLVKWLPSGASEVPPGGRALYMIPKVFDEFSTGTWFAPRTEAATVTRRRKAALRAVLSRFVHGHFMNNNWDIKELGTKKVDQTMRGYWEFRSQPPQEETRLFGFVPLPGAFVATDFQPRGNFLTQAHWLAQRQSCQAVWDALTGNSPYLSSPWPLRTRGDLEAYLS